MPLENPVLLKEMRSRMRGGRTYWLMAGYVATLCVIFFIMYGEARSWSATGSYSLDPRFAQKLGRDLYVWMTIAQVLLGVLLAPAFTSGALTIEREQRTFDLLAISLVRPRSIVWGKLASALSFVVLLTFASVPLVSVCFMLGGVDTREFAAAYAFILGNAFFFGIVGLFCSSLCWHTTAATMLAYGIGGFLVAGTGVADFFIRSVWGSSAAGIGDFLLLFNPIVAISDLCYGTGRWGGSSLPAAWGLPVWGTTLVLYGVLSVLMLWVSVRRAKPWPVGEDGRRKTQYAIRNTQHATRSTTTTKPALHRDRSLPFDIANPVLKRELLSRLRARRPSLQNRIIGCFLTLLIGGTYLYLLRVMFIYNAVQRDWAAWWVGVSFAQLVLVSFIAPALTASVFTVEKEQRSLEMLLLTRLTRWEICWGKLWSRLASIAMLLMVFLPMTLISAALGGVNLIAFAGSYGLLLATSFALGVLGLACSAFFRKTVTALASAMVATVGVLLVMPMVTALLLETYSIRAWGETRVIFETAVGTLSPYFALGMLSDEMDSWNRGQPVVHCYITWLYCCWLFVLAAFVLLHLVCARLDRLSRT